MKRKNFQFQQSLHDWRILVRTASMIFLQFMVFFIEAIVAEWKLALVQGKFEAIKFIASRVVWLMIIALLTTAVFGVCGSIYSYIVS